MPPDGEPARRTSAWVDVGLIPLLNLAVALLFAGLVVLIIGENPLEAMGILLKGAVGSLKGWGYLLYYATNFIFTGLAVAVAFHAGLFNIGGEGQAYFAGLGAAIVGLGLEFLPWPIVDPSRHSWRRCCLALSGPGSRATCRPSAAATSSSPPSCSISSPPA